MASNNAFKFNGGLPSPERQAQLVQLARIREAAAHADKMRTQLLEATSHANRDQLIKTLAREIAKAKQSKPTNNKGQNKPSAKKRRRRNATKWAEMVSLARVYIRKFRQVKLACDRVANRKEFKGIYTSRTLQNFFSKEKKIKQSKPKP